MPLGRTLCAVGALAALVWPPAVIRADPSWSASAGATSNYVYRGISQTYGGGAVQLGANYHDPLGWFAGAWGSNVDPYPGDASSKELDLYAGVNRPLGADFTLRGAYTHYAYLRDPRPQRYDHNELAVTLAYLDLVAATVSYQPDSSSYSLLGFARRRTTIAYELTGRWPLREGWAVTAGGGYYDLHDLFGIGYWAGMSDCPMTFVTCRSTSAGFSVTRPLRACMRMPVPTASGRSRRSCISDGTGPVRGSGEPFGSVGVPTL